MIRFRLNIWGKSTMWLPLGHPKSISLGGQNSLCPITGILIGYVGYGVSDRLER